jgi:hypothetical protein
VFLGRSENAVRSQVWAAVCACLLVMLAKQALGLPQTLHRILQTLSISPFEQIPLAELLAEPYWVNPQTLQSNQLILKLI